MNYREKAATISIDEIETVIQQYGSIQAVVYHITGGKKNEGVRAIIALRVKTEGLSGLRKQNVSTRYTPEQLKEALVSAICWSDVYRSLGLSVCDHNKAGIIRFAQHHNIPAPAFSKENLTEAFQRGKRGWNAETIFCENSTYRRSNVRGAAIKYNILGYYHCTKCGQQPEWDGSKLTLELDHINGTHDDNRKENLRWLCPNCHSQTITYKGKNR